MPLLSLQCQEGEAGCNLLLEASGWPYKGQLSGKAIPRPLSPMWLYRANVEEIQKLTSFASPSIGRFQTVNS